jgi:hypothetical protein
MNIRKYPTARAVIDELKLHGISDYTVEKHNGRHVKIKWDQQTVVVSSTPSDHRAAKNNRALVRRILRG